jgi:hypothetical protein
MDALRLARPLKKREAEALMTEFDAHPIEALTRSLRIVLGSPHATWEHLLLALPATRRVALQRNEEKALDLLAAELNETRTIGRD